MTDGSFCEIITDKGITARSLPTAEALQTVCVVGDDDEMRASVVRSLQITVGVGTSLNIIDVGSRHLRGPPLCVPPCCVAVVVINLRNRRSIEAMEAYLRIVWGGADRDGSRRPIIKILGTHGCKPYRRLSNSQIKRRLHNLLRVHYRRYHH